MQYHTISGDEKFKDSQSETYDAVFIVRITCCRNQPHNHPSFKTEGLMRWEICNVSVFTAL